MAYNFASASIQYLSVADTATLDITGAFTISCSFKPDGTLTTFNRGLVTKWFTSTNQRSYMLNYSATSPASNSKIDGAVSSDGTFQAGNNVTGGTNLGTSSWKHGAFVFAPSTSVTIYVDGSQDAQNTSSIAASAFSGSAELWIGMVSVASASNAFSGDIAEVAIYDTNLNASEIVSLAKGFKPFRVRPQSLVFYSPLVRSLSELREKLAITNNNSATVAAHPRVY